MRRKKQTTTKDNAQLVIDALMSAKGSDYISLLADVIEFCRTGEGFESLMSKVESIRIKEHGIRI